MPSSSDTPRVLVVHRAEDTVGLPERHAGHALNQAQAVRRTVMPATPPIPFSSVDPLYMKVVTRSCQGLKCSQSVFSSQICAESMERLWSLAVATSGNRWQIGRLRKRRNQAKTVATGCDQLPRDIDGKEGVDGSSPSEGLPKVPANWHLSVV
jgi:hypothetical protein